MIPQLFDSPVTQIQIDFLQEDIGHLNEWANTCSEANLKRRSQIAALQERVETLEVFDKDQWDTISWLVNRVKALK